MCKVWLRFSERKFHPGTLLSILSFLHKQSEISHTLWKKTKQNKKTRLSERCCFCKHLQKVWILSFLWQQIKWKHRRSRPFVGVFSACVLYKAITESQSASVFHTHTHTIGNNDTASTNTVKQPKRLFLFKTILRYTVFSHSWFFFLLFSFAVILGQCEVHSFCLLVIAQKKKLKWSENNIKKKMTSLTHGVGLFTSQLAFG